jgi:hypothetical protein
MHLSPRIHNSCTSAAKCDILVSTVRCICPEIKALFTDSVNFGHHPPT